MHNPIRRRFIGESVVLRDQHVRALVLVGDGGAAPCDRSCVPVVVGDVHYIAAVLEEEQQDRLRSWV